MSGLAVILHRDGQPVEPGEMRAMLAAIPHRALDGAWVRVWPAAGLGLGYAKLAITPEETTEQQPLISPRTGCVVIADARLDNRRELMTQLPDRPAPNPSDAELILRAYEAWGAEAPARLLGDFAIVIWDPRSQKLVISRDTSGQRSLFYRDDGRTFTAASELHQLLQDPTAPVEVNDNRVYDFLVPLNAVRNSKEQSETFYRGVFLVPAGHTMVVTREGVRTWRYWDINPRTELRYGSDDEYAEHFRALFFEVVEARLRSTGPVGAMLSGGLDSSSIVCSAQELYRAGRAVDHGFTSFSAVFAGQDCDERPLIEEMRAKYGFPACYFPPGKSAGKLQLQPKNFAEEPHMHSAPGENALLRTAVERGVRVLLTGDVADAYVGGSRLVFDSLLRQGHLRAFWRHLRTYRRLGPDESLRKTILLWCLGPLLPIALQRQLMARNTRRFLVEHAAQLMPGYIAEPVREEVRQRHVALCVGLERQRRFASQSREDQFEMLYPPLVSRNPPGWPVEVARPYADRRLHEFMLAIPPEQHFEPHPDSDLIYAGSKRLVRRALRGVLPESIRTRTTKTVFSSVYNNDLESHWADYEAAFGPSAHPLVVERGYVEHGRFWSRLEQWRAGGAAEDFIYLIQIVGLETWLRGFNQPRPQLVTVPVAWRTQTLAHGTTPVREVPVGAV